VKSAEMQEYWQEVKVPIAPESLSKKEDWSVFISMDIDGTIAGIPLI